MEDENITSSSGSPAQVRAVSEYFTHRCKQHHRIWLIIGHVTKSWEIAGPKYLEHIVDVVSYLEWDRSWELRFLRNRKNRFGNAEETAIFRMTPQWLAPATMSEVNKSTSICLWEPWNVLSVALDTTRPMLVWVEVLCNRTKFSYPKRVGLSSNRLDMLIAIIEKHCRVDLSEVDIYVNVPWDTGISDTWLDLAVVVWIIWQVRNKSIPADNVFVWEVGLWGQPHHTTPKESRK
jgi:DNA repair protein RadA/Sms